MLLLHRVGSRDVVPGAYRPLVTDGVSVELHRLPPAALALPWRRWHVVSFFLAGERGVRRESLDGERRGRFARGDTGIYPAGAGETVTWPEGVEAVHVHLNPRAHGFGDTVGLPYVFRRRDPALRELGRELEEALRRPGTERWQQTAPILSALTRHLLDRYACPTGDLPVPRLGRERLDDVLAYVHAGLSSRIRVGDLALKAGLSRYHFARAFRERLGLAPSQYVRRARVERAKHLLSCGGESLAGVAHACGFADQSHLTREFRAVVGATPRRFRLAGA